MTKSTTLAELGIEAVAQRSGLSQHLIRMWERRYGAVKPARTESNRRLYSEADAVRLGLLNRAVHAGHRISDIAKLPTPKLEKMLEHTQLAAVAAPPAAIAASDYMERALAAIMAFDSEALGDVLSRADVDLGHGRSLEQVIMPLLERIGTLWHDGEMRVAHEHMATAAITHHVGAALANFRYPAHAPVLLLATPLGQMHEAGALAVGVVAALGGWRPVYIGPNLPADEIAGAAQKSSARAVALSLVFPSDDPRLPAELTRLRRLLPQEVPILVGGRAAAAYRSPIERGDVVHIADITDLRNRLALLRASAEI